MSAESRKGAPGHRIAGRDGEPARDRRVRRRAHERLARGVEPPGPQVLARADGTHEWLERGGPAMSRLNEIIPSSLPA